MPYRISQVSGSSCIYRVSLQLAVSFVWSENVLGFLNFLGKVINGTFDQRLSNFL